jgi:hypothetical protein
MSANNVQFFFTMRDILKIHHWQTNQFSTHTAIDKAIDELDENVDKYVEVYMSKFKRPHFSSANSSIHLKNCSRKMIIKFVQGCVAHLQGSAFNKGLDQKKDSELFNIRDEMVATLNQLLYLFTLH